MNIMLIENKNCDILFCEKFYRIKNVSKMHKENMSKGTILNKIATS